MQPLTRHSGAAVVLRRSDVDTDQIIPAEFCKRLTKSGYADALFAHWRTEPGFVLNRPASTRASVLVAAHNFGTGSSREHAVWALRDWGFGAVIASSFGDIFLRNAWKNGLMAVQLPAGEVDRLAFRIEEGCAGDIAIDLVECVISATGWLHSFEVDQRARRLLLEGRDDIAETLDAEPVIAAHERDRLPWLPRLAPGCLTAPRPEKVGVAS